MPWCRLWACIRRQLCHCIGGLVLELVELLHLISVSEAACFAVLHACRCQPGRIDHGRTRNEQCQQRDMVGGFHEFGIAIT